MKIRNRTVIYLTGGIIALVVMGLLVKFIMSNQYGSRIPRVPNLQTLSQPVQEQISGALENAIRKPSAENLGMLGMVYHSSANYEEASKCYNLALQKSRSEWIWNYYLGYLNMEMGKSEAVIENFRKVTENNPDIDLAWYYLGEEYNNLRKSELAEESFGKITESNHNQPSSQSTRVDHFPLGTYAKFQLSRIYFETGRTEMAENTLKQIIQVNRTFGPAYRLLGNLYKVQGDQTLSERYGARANDLVAFSPPVDTLVDRLVLVSRSELYLLKKIDEAERSIYDQWTLRLVNHALEYMPENKYLVSKAIKIYLWMGMHEQATALIPRHMSYFPESAPELNKTGMYFFRNGLYQQSITYITRGLELKPGDVENQMRLAISFHFVGERQKSDDVINEILEQNRDDPDVVADVANLLYFNFREREKAKDLITSLKLHAPTNPKVQKITAGMAEEKGDIREAISLYQSSVRGNPDDLTTIRYLGNLLVKQEMWEASIQHFREALKYHPNDPQFLERLGTLLVMVPDTSLLNLPEGIRYLERSFIHMSSRPYTLISAGKSLAIACEKLGDKRNAISTIQQTMEIGRLEKIPSSQMEELESLYQRFQAMQ